jgi:hypothetical protein
MLHLCLAVAPYRPHVADNAGERPRQLWEIFTQLSRGVLRGEARFFMVFSSFGESSTVFGNKFEEIEVILGKKTVGNHEVPSD